MAKPTLSRQQQIGLWRKLREHLAMDLEPSISLDRAERLLAQLPGRIADETVGERIRRASLQGSAGQEARSRAATLQGRRIRFTPFTEIVRLAASTGDEEIPLPDPGRALESQDGRFQLEIARVGDKIRITAHALGFAADEFANRWIGIAGQRADDEPIALIGLDEDGDGGCEVEDGIEVRRALLRPIIGLIEDV